MNGRFVAGVQQEDAGGDQFLFAEPAAIGLGGDELTDQVVAQSAAPLLDIAAQERGEGSGRRHGLVLHRAGAAELIHRDHPMRPIEQLPPHIGGNAKQFGDDDDRDARGELLDKIDLAAGLEAVDQLVGERGDARRRDARHGARRRRG